jgi:hypothetical protein
MGKRIGSFMLSRVIFLGELLLVSRQFHPNPTAVLGDSQLIYSRELG